MPNTPPRAPILLGPCDWKTMYCYPQKGECVPKDSWPYAFDECWDCTTAMPPHGTKVWTPVTACEPTKVPEADGAFIIMMMLILFRLIMRA